MLRFLRSNKNSLPDDEALLEAWHLAGNMEALGQLYERYIELIYGVCLKYLQNEADAEDAVMGIFEQLSEKTRTHEVQNFRAWLYVLAKNYCLMELRKTRTVVPEADFMHSNGILHLEETEAREARLRDCIAQLPPAQRSSIELFYFAGQSYQEIAAQCGETLGKIRSSIQNGRRNLRNCMEELERLKRE